MNKFFLLVSLFAVSSLFVSCKTETAPPPNNVPATYSVGGTVSGLDGTLILQNNGADNLPLDVNGAFTFSTKLRSGSVYNVTIKDRPTLQNCAVAHGLGEVREADVTDVAVTCADKEWQTVGELGASVIDDYPVVAVKDDGTIFTLWVQSWTGGGTTVDRVFSRIFKDGIWSAALPISPEGSGGDASKPRLALDGSGGVMAVWLQSNGSKKIVYASRYSGTSWQTPEAISNTGLDNCEDPQIIAGDGELLAIWTQDNGSRDSVYTATYSSGSWGSPNQISPNSGGNALTPQAAYDQSGDVVAVWTQYSGSNWRIYSSWRNGGSWNSAETIISNDIGSAWRPQVAAPAAGKAVAVWYQQYGSKDVIFSSSFADGSWQTPSSISDSSGGDAAYPVLAMGADGIVRAVWEQGDSSGQRHIYTAAYAASWSASQLLNTGMSDSGSGQIALDGKGNGLIVWYQSVGGANFAYASRLKNGAWSGPQQLSQDSAGGNVFAPNVAISPSGDAALVWRLNETSGTSFKAFSRIFR